jgi:hypothetical protein
MIIKSLWLLFIFGFAFKSDCPANSSPALKILQRLAAINLYPYRCKLLGSLSEEEYEERVRLLFSKQEMASN